MDIQAILNNSSSSSTSDVHGRIDLEQILRDDEDSEEDYRPPPRFRDSLQERTRPPSSQDLSDDWAVLQAILNEGEDTDDEELYRSAGMARLKPTNVNVNAILDSSDSDDDNYLPDTSTITMMSLPASPRIMNSILEKIDLKKTFSGDKTDSPERLTAQFREPSSTRTDMTAVDEESTRRAMAYAQAAEKKMLKAGRREIVSPLMVKRRLKPKVELRSRAKAAAAPHSSSTPTPSSQIRYNFSGIVDHRAMENISKSIVDHSNGTKMLCGLPTCLSFNSKFILVGTQMGIVLVYDLFETLRRRLGGDPNETNFQAKTAGSVTSVDVSFNGEMVLAGYTSGIIVLWDTIRGSALRTVTEPNPSPITNVKFISNLKAITVDTAGVVNKLSFTKNVIWSNYSVETECLLDGTAGQILAMSTLAPYALVKPSLQSLNYTVALRQMSMIALTSDRSSFAVGVEPKVSVLHRWPRPPPKTTSIVETSIDLPSDQTYLPCLAWNWALISGAGNLVVPILARGWGCCLQLLRATFTALDDDDLQTEKKESAQFQWPAFGVHEEIDASYPIVALQWLNDRTLVYLTVNNEFNLVDTVMMTLLERLDFGGAHVVYAEFALSRGAATSRHLNEAELCSTFQNSMASSDDRLMTLCQAELKCISVVSARARVAALESDGEWLEALALALDHYESVVVSQEDRKRDPVGLKDISCHPEFRSVKGDEEEWIAKLLIRYMNLAVDNAPTQTSFTGSASPGRGKTKIDLAQSHFQMLAGVCVEFCVITRRLDLLYGPIFRQFESVGYTSVFLDVLEPYVLNEKLVYIAPEVMAYFVEHCKATNGIATVERCLLHMDCTIMDFDSILNLLRKNEMYSAMFFVFNQGLNDFVTPLEILLERIFDDVDAGRALSMRRKDGVPQNNLEKLGYKALFYIQTCFNGKTFPQEKAFSMESTQPTVRSDLIQFLFQKQYKPSAQAKRGHDRMFVIGQRASTFPYLRILLQVDPRATLDTLSLAIDASGGETFLPTPNQVTSSTIEVEAKAYHGLTDVLASIILESNESRDTQVSLVQNRGALNAFLDFAAKYVIKGFISVEKDVAHMVFQRLADLYSFSSELDAKTNAQKQIMEILSALPKDSYDPDHVLKMIDEAGIHRAALVLHQQVASAWQDEEKDDIELRCVHFRKAIECYFGDHDEIFQQQVFEYIRKECSGAIERNVGSGSKKITLRDSLHGKLPALVRLNPLQACRIVSELFADDLDDVVNALCSDEKALFLFFREVNAADLGNLDPTAGSVLKLSMEHHHRYLTLMARLYPELVYEYLSKHDNYRQDDALRLCQEYRIADASAYLLERMGNVTSALQLILQTLETRLMSLKRVIRGTAPEHLKQYSMSYTSRDSDATLSKQEREVEGVRRIFVVALDLCERNSGTPSARMEQGSQLFFSLLDRLLNAKGFLRLEKERPDHGLILANVLSELLRLTMERMVSNVALEDLVRKFTMDHSGSSLGDIREMVEKLLLTYGFDLRLLQNASGVFQDDMYQMQAKRKALKMKATPVRSVMDTNLSESREPSTFHKIGKGGQIFSLSGRGNATVAIVDEPSYSKKAENGLSSALRRLRSRRDPSSIGKSISRGIPLQTATDLQYQAGENEPVIFGERQPGVLSEAQHRGRLVHF